MSGVISEEIKEKILKYLGSVGKAKNRDVARAIGLEKDITDKAIGELAKEGKIEYRNFGGVTFVCLKGKYED